MGRLRRSVGRRYRWRLALPPWAALGGLLFTTAAALAFALRGRRSPFLFSLPPFPFSPFPVPAFVGRRGRRRSLCAAFAALRRTALHFENLLLTSTLAAFIMGVAVGRAWQRLCDNPNGKNKATAANKAERPQRGQERKTWNIQSIFTTWTAI